MFAFAISFFMMVLTTHSLKKLQEAKSTLTSLSLSRNFSNIKGPIHGPFTQTCLPATLNLSSSSPSLLPQWNPNTHFSLKSHQINQNPILELLPILLSVLRSTLSTLQNSEERKRIRFKR